MTTDNQLAIFLIDFYKVGHREQYPDNVTQIFTNFTPRSSRVPGQFHVRTAGFTYFAKKYLTEYFSAHFFKVDLSEVLTLYKAVLKQCLGIDNPRTDHIEALHNYGYLPLRFWAIPEGTAVPLNCPQYVVTNTEDDMYWLPNYIETLMSNILWMPATSCTTARRYRDIFTKYAKLAGETDMSFVSYQGHDFSMRGMSGIESAILSGLGHLMVFNGTDSVPAILAAHQYYGAALACGGSVPATEHSVMCAGTQEDELNTFRRLITEVYPNGIVSIVSDTWDLWKVLMEYVPALKETIFRRDGKIVIRPDSGDPVNILCGDPDSYAPGPHAGVLRLLVAAMGTAPHKGDVLPMINKAGAIYGDSITPERAEAICHRCVYELKLSPFNLVFGIGSYTYQYVTRDTYGFALKATAVRRNGQLIPIFKKPITDTGGKTSHRGIPVVYTTDISSAQFPDYMVVEGGAIDDLDNCAFQRVWEDGVLLVNPQWSTICERARAEQ